MFVPSIEERLETAITRINLLTAALHADANEAGLDEQDLIDAVRPVVAEIANELYFAQKALKTIGETVMDLPAPTDDEANTGNVETVAQREKKTAGVR